MPNSKKFAEFNKRLSQKPEHIPQSAPLNLCVRPKTTLNCVDYAPEGISVNDLNTLFSILTPKKRPAILLQNPSQPVVKRSNTSKKVHNVGPVKFTTMTDVESHWYQVFLSKRKTALDVVIENSPYDVASTSTSITAPVTKVMAEDEISSPVETVVPVEAVVTPPAPAPKLPRVYLPSNATALHSPNTTARLIKCAEESLERWGRKENHSNSPKRMK